jgi:hypothetical protein
MTLLGAAGPLVPIFLNCRAPTYPAPCFFSSASICAWGPTPGVAAIATGGLSLPELS